MSEWTLLQRKTHCYVTPFIEVIGKVFAKSVERVWFGKSFRGCLVYYQNGVMHWYGQQKVVEETFKYVSEKILENHFSRKETKAIFEKNVKKLLQLSKKIHYTKLTSLSPQQLWRLYEGYIHAYEEAYIYSEPLPLATSEVITEYLRQELVKKISEKNLINELITTLTTPKEKSFIRKEEEDLLKLAAEIQENKELVIMFEKHDLKNLENTKILKKIKNHAKNFCWIPYDYGVMVWDLTSFLSSLQKLVLNINAKNELTRKKDEYNKLQKQQLKLMKRYNLPKKIRNLFAYLQWATHMMDYKKELFTKSHYLVIPLMEEISRRVSTSATLARFMRHEEIRKLLLQNKIPSVKELQQHHDDSILVWNKVGRTRFMSEKEKNNFIRKNITKKEETAKTTKIYGICASVGRCKGKVKVIKSAMHILTVEDGDILVAPMTSPDYVIGMKKAAAIVTDEGGLTSHAAIVARELKIPCIVGTKEATKRLKDGDFVEVNANHGWVVILS